VRLAGNLYVNLGVNVSAGVFSATNSLLTMVSSASVVAGNLATVQIVPRDAYNNPINISNFNVSSFVSSDFNLFYCRIS